MADSKAEAVFEAMVCCKKCGHSVSLHNDVICWATRDCACREFGTLKHARSTDVYKEMYGGLE